MVEMIDLVQPLDNSDDVCHKISDLFRALSHPIRIKIVRELNRTPSNVSSLRDILGSSQANISKHLNVLLESSLVERKREGVENIYRLVNSQVLELCCCALRCIKHQLQIEINLLECLDTAESQFD